MTTTEPTGPGFWRYAVRELEEDGTPEGTIWDSYSSYSYEPFTSALEAREFAEPFVEHFEVVRTWIPETVWEEVPE